MKCRAERPGAPLVARYAGVNQKSSADRKSCYWKAGIAQRILAPEAEVLYPFWVQKVLRSK